MPPRIGPRTPARVFLKDWRKHYGLTLEALGGRFEPQISKSTVQRIEDNPRPPAVNVLAAYAEALDPELHWTALARPPAEHTPRDDLAAVAGHLEQAAQMLRKRGA